MGWRKKPDSPAAARPFSVGRALWAFAWKLGLAVLLVYAALQILVRTGWFRSRVEAELSRLAGMEMRVGRIRATESLNLRIRDAIGVSEVAGIEARLARIRWRLLRPRGEPMLESVRVDGLALTIAPDSRGVIQPAALDRLSRKVFEWAAIPLPVGVAPEPGSAGGPTVAKPGATATAPETWVRGPLVFRNMSVRWQDAQGNPVAAVVGLDVTWMSELTPNGGRISHLECRAAEINVVKGPRVRGLHVEMVEAGGKQFLVDASADDWGGARPPAPPEAEFREMLDAMDAPAE